MLHIILLILTIIGWILLVILGLIVLLISVTLFVPLRYRADASCKGTLDTLYGRIRFSWLSHLVSGFAVYDGGKLDWSVRIAWKKIKAGDEEAFSEGDDYGDRDGGTGEEETSTDVIIKEGQVKDKPGNVEPHKDKPVKVESDKDKPGNVESGKDKPVKVNPVKADIIVKDKSTVKADVSDEEVLGKLISEELEADESEADVQLLERLIQGEQNGYEEPERDREPEEKPKEKQQEGMSDKLLKLYQKICKKLNAIYKKIKYTFHKICDTIKSLLEKKDKLEAFITDEAHKAAIFAVLAELKRLLRSLKPKELKADIHYGFEDPSITGRILAAISMAYPFIGGHVDIEPDFEQAVLEGSLLVTGRVRVLYAVSLFWNLVWNKNIRTTFRHIRKFKL